MNPKEKMKKRIHLAAGHDPVELVLKNCRVVNVFNHQIVTTNVAIDSGKIIGLGDYAARREIDLGGRYLVPGLIDSHVHIESSQVTPGEMARVVVPKGTTTLVADPHEIANVLGTPGIEFMIEASKNIPLNVFFMIPSCVPATEFEHSGASLKAEDIAPLLARDKVIGLGEMMDYPGVVSASDTVVDKMLLAEKHLIDGHSPGLSGKDLNAYIINGIRTDHECATVEEMTEKLGLGMYIALREGSAARDLEQLLKGVTPENQRRCTLCTDDKNPHDVIHEGHIDHSVRKAIAMGIPPISAIQMATINTAECYHLRDIGAIAPGYDADLVVVEDLMDFRAERVFKKGVLVGEGGRALFDIDLPDLSQVTDTVKLRDITLKDLEIPLEKDIVRVIRMTPNSLVTEMVTRKVSVDENHCFRVEHPIDILKLAVIERHGHHGTIGLGLIENFRLRGGAIATTIAHDSHNLIVVGDNDHDMLLAIDAIKKIKGGIALAAGGRVQGTLPLTIGGILSERSMDEVSQKLLELKAIAHRELGIPEGIDPFMTLSFMALPVIPELKLTDQGLFNVTDFTFVDLEIKEVP
ncbi:MAG: adenosine deaminase [delta proteobacterium ML8_F1]|nr:MAG: adenosine deaminase [delta proteobacterium ML8_F1]